MPNDDQTTKTETEAKTPDGGGFAAPPCSQIKPCLRMWAVVDECGNINHTTISLRDEDAIKEWMDQEQAVTRLFLNGPCPSWEGYEARGMSVQRVDIIPSANDQGHQSQPGAGQLPK